MRRITGPFVAIVVLTASGCTGMTSDTPTRSITSSTVGSPSPTTSAASAWHNEFPAPTPLAPTPLPTTTNAAVANNTACLDYYALTDRWYDSGDLVQYALDLRAVIPKADEFMAGQLANFANALDGIASDVPFGQAEAIAGMQIARVCEEAGVPAPVSENFAY